jgi:hypothetical protein
MDLDFTEIKQRVVSVLTNMLIRLLIVICLSALWLVLATVAAMLWFG